MSYVAMLLIAVVVVVYARAVRSLYRDTPLLRRRLTTHTVSVGPSANIGTWVKLGSQSGTLCIPPRFANYVTVSDSMVHAADIDADFYSASFYYRDMPRGVVNIHVSSRQRWGHLFSRYGRVDAFRLHRSALTTGLWYPALILRSLLVTNFAECLFEPVACNSLKGFRATGPFRPNHPDAPPCVLHNYDLYADHWAYSITVMDFGLLEPGEAEGMVGSFQPATGRPVKTNWF